MKMALSPPIAGLFINCVTIFPLTSLVYGCQGGSGLFFLVLVLVFKFKFFKKNSPSHFGLSSDLLILSGAYSALPCCWLIPIISCSTTDTTPLKCLSLRLASVQILTTETQLVSSSTSAVIGLSFLLTYTLATDKIT